MNKNKTMKRQDLLTNEEFIPLRINQKFANPKNRVKYYNNKANQLRHNNAFVNKPLHNNIRILNELLDKKSEVVFHKQYMAGKGFSFGVHTHYEDYNGKRYIAIYQYIIIPIENEQIKIIKK